MALNDDLDFTEDAQAQGADDWGLNVTPSPEVQAMIAKRQASPTPAVPAAQPVVSPQGMDNLQSPSVKNYIAERLTKGDAAMKEAQGKARENQDMAGLTEGLGQISAGLARSNTFSPGAYKYLHDEANRPVEDIQAATKNRLANIESATKETADNRQMALDDPDSMQSNVARNLAKSQLEKYHENSKIVDGMSAADLKEFLQKPLDQMEARASREAIMKLKSQELGLKRKELGNKDQDKALGTVQTLLETARGNPAVAQAERDLYAAQKADSLANLYGNPNNLSPQMVQLLSSEIGKIAQGGSPTMHELEGLNIKTAPGGLASIMQRFANKPTAANAGEFVKQYQDYARALTRDAEGVIREKYGRVLETNRKKLGEENYQNLSTHYMNRFNKGEAAKPAASAAGAPRQAAGGQKYNPGDVVNVRGKNWVVGADGDSLDPL